MMDVIATTTSKVMASGMELKNSSHTGVGRRLGLLTAVRSAVIASAFI